MRIFLASILNVVLFQKKGKQCKIESLSIFFHSYVNIVTPVL
jgi:hypothetical protein